MKTLLTVLPYPVGILTVYAMFTMVVNPLLADFADTFATITAVLN